MKYSTAVIMFIFTLVALVSSAAAYDTLSHKLERKGINTAQAIRLNSSNASELVGQRGIVMGTCRQLQGQPLVLQGTDNRNYQLPDGVYESAQGFRIHIRMGSIERISTSSKLAR